MSLWKGFNKGAVLVLRYGKAIKVWLNMFSHRNTGCGSNVVEIIRILPIRGLRFITKSCSMWGDYTKLSRMKAPTLDELYIFVICFTYVMVNIFYLVNFEINLYTCAVLVT